MSFVFGADVVEYLLGVDFIVISELYLSMLWTWNLWVTTTYVSSKVKVLCQSTIKWPLLLQQIWFQQVWKMNAVNMYSSWLQPYIGGCNSVCKLLLIIVLFPPWIFLNNLLFRVKWPQLSLCGNETNFDLVLNTQWIQSVALRQLQWDQWVDITKLAFLSLVLIQWRMMQ